MQITKKAVLFTIILGVTLMFSSQVSASTEKVFSDVDQTTKYSQAIEHLKNNGIVSGYPDGTFQPEKTLNRAELLKILVEPFDSAQGSTSSVQGMSNCFPDVKDEWFAKYVCYAKEKGIVSGYPDGSFQPGNEVNFVEALKMMLGVLEIEYTEGGVWYQDIVNKAAEKEFIPFDIVVFDQKLQRGQMSEMMTRGIKDKNGNGELAWYLQNAGDCEVNYDSILQKRNIEDECFTSVTLHALGNLEWTELVGKNTTELNLSYRSLESVEGLENLSNLTRLDLGANELQDISFLSDLTNLTELDLRDNWLWDISPVANLVNLEKLNLNLNIMGDPAPLGNLTKLKWLGIYKNQYLYDISALDSLEDLEYIDLGLAELNEGELERFVANHPETEVENVLKPWVGMKGFDLDSRGINNPIFDKSISYTKLNITLNTESTDIATSTGQVIVEDLITEISNNISNEVNHLSELTIDDLENLQGLSLELKNNWNEIKDLSSDSQIELLWNEDIHTEWIKNKLAEQNEIKEILLENPIQNATEGDYDFNTIIIFLNLNLIDLQKGTNEINDFITRISVEIAKDINRRNQGLDVEEKYMTGEELLISIDDYNFGSNYVYLSSKGLIFKIGSLRAVVMYLMRYPGIGDLEFNSVEYLD